MIGNGKWGRRWQVAGGISVARVGQKKEDKYKKAIAKNFIPFQRTKFNPSPIFRFNPILVVLNKIIPKQIGWGLSVFLAKKFSLTDRFFEGYMYIMYYN